LGRIRLCKEDRERYGGPEWVEFDHDTLANCEAGFLERFEDATGMTITEFGDALNRGSVKSLRAMVWVARSLAGCEDPWPTFQPRVLRMDVEGLGDDDAPPAPTNRAGRRAKAVGVKPARRSAT